MDRNVWFITGGTGSLGREILPRLASADPARAFRPRGARAPALAAASAVILFGSSGHLLLGPGEGWFARCALLLLLVTSTDASSQIWGTLPGTRSHCPGSAPPGLARGRWGAS